MQGVEAVFLKIFLCGSQHLYRKNRQKQNPEGFQAAPDGPWASCPAI
jgi:hypothetical protein